MHFGLDFFELFAKHGHVFTLVFSMWCFLFHTGSSFVINSDSQRYRTWPNGIVNFILPPNEYNAQEEGVIRQAMQQIQNDMSGCVRFQEVFRPTTPGLRYTVITHNGGLSGVGGQSCYAFPGMVVSQTGQGQFMAMQGGTNGCLASPRQAMRLLVSLLGLRSEHNKPNRDNFIQINQANLNAVAMGNNIFNIYDASKSLSDSGFDYNSITLPDSQTVYSNNGQPTIVSRTGTPFQNPGRLSPQDCQALRYMYNCNIQCNGESNGSNGFTTPPPHLPFSPFPTGFTFFSTRVPSSTFDVSVDFKK
ncbi:hypothetical protein RvY_03834 [Ramazzottius varieornatus]|uniref:Peptidase M12A domain-containing protein n=1 Tax=Ramazzottius varieornatus TaxID=947166 RepID=A0A1D1UPF0_RAMVA|nr:hypothetical protein RvY_03834 [Ramazzottius varieornatus]